MLLLCSGYGFFFFFIIIRFCVVLLLFFCFFVFFPPFVSFGSFVHSFVLALGVYICLGMACSML